MKTRMFMLIIGAVVCLASCGGKEAVSDKGQQAEQEVAGSVTMSSDSLNLGVGYTADSLICGLDSVVESQPTAEMVSVAHVADSKMYYVSTDARALGGMIMLTIKGEYATREPDVVTVEKCKSLKDAITVAAETAKRMSTARNFVVSVEKGDTGEYEVGYVYL